MHPIRTRASEHRDLRYEEGDVFVVLGRIAKERIEALTEIGQRQYPELMQLARD